MNQQRPPLIHAQQFSSVRSIPGAVVPLFRNVAGFEDVLAYDMGPSTNTDPFPVPAFREHCIVIATQGNSIAEGQVDGQFRRVNVIAGGLNGLGLIPAGMPSQWRMYDPGVRSTHIFISPLLLARVTAQVLDLDPARAVLPPMLFFEDALLLQVGLGIACTARNPEPGSLLCRESLSQALAVHLLVHYARITAALPAPHGRLAAPALRQVLDYIEAAPDADLSLRNLADLVHLSPYHLSRLFRATVGQNLHRYVLEDRLKRSRRLLLDGNLSLADIAAKIGFSDESHFLRRFKDFYGITPGALRKERKIVP